jgi:putative ABC transport system permease protein
MNPWQWWRNRARRESELEEEIQTHLRLAERDRIDRGETSTEARANVRCEFGNVLLTKEVTRAQWGWVWLEQLAMDIRYVLRGLRHSPGFTAVAVLSLALGIGANATLFGLIDALVLRSLPVVQPGELVSVDIQDQGDFTNAIWEQLRDRQNVFVGVFAWAHTGFDLAEGGEKQPVEGLYVSGEFFRTLGVQSLRGRVLMPDDDRRGGAAVAVISHAFWERQFGADPKVVGRTLRINRHPFTIVGVTRPGFFGVDVGTRFDVAVPLASEPIFDPERPALAERLQWWLSVMGRLKPGITLQKARTGLNVLAPTIFEAALSQDLKPEQQRSFLRNQFTVHPGATGFSSLRERYTRGLVILLSMVGVVLLIACANLANLLLARADVRRREVAVRLALGAGRARLVRQFLTESLLLAALGALSGVALAQWGSRALIGYLDLFLDLSLDLRVLGFTAVLSIVTSLLFGLVPALLATRLAPNDALKGGVRGLTGRRGRWSLGRMLVAAQVALSLLLVVGAGLLVQSLRALLTQDMGFEREGVMMVDPDLRNTAYTAGQQPMVAEELLARFQVLPAVASASRSAVTPISGGSWQWEVRVDSPNGQVRSEHAWFNLVSPGFFETMRTPQLAGRCFTSQDAATSPRVAIVNETMARKLFPGISPLGKVYRDDAPPGAPVKEFITEIVGVVRDAKYRRLRDEMPPTIYLPILQNPAPFPVVGTYELRFGGSMADVTGRIREAVHAVNPRISLEFRLLSIQVEDSLLQERLIALLSALFGLLALVLAAIGLYGLVTYSVTRQLHEIGIRIALGAGRSAVQWLVLREVGALLLGGLTLGLAMALTGTRLVRTMLYGLTPNDPWTLAGACVVLLIAGAIAGWVPARRAARVDPMTSLRHE